MSFVSNTSSNDKSVSVKTGSAFWADGGDRTTDDSEFSLMNRLSATTAPEEDDDNDSDGTETGRDELDDEGVIDDVGAQEAFVSGMIWALSRKMVPGDPYTPPGIHHQRMRTEISESGDWKSV